MPPKAEAGDLHSWHLFVMRLGESVKTSRADFIQEMSDMGIACSVHFIPLHIQPYWRETYNLHENDFPNALNNFIHAVSLPLYTKMTDDDQNRVIKAVKTIICG